jgi:hypothetical protein
MPIAILLCCVGWSLLWIGIKRETKTPKSKLSNHNEITIFVPTPDQKHSTYDIL